MSQQQQQQEYSVLTRSIQHATRSNIWIMVAILVLMMVGIFAYGYAKKHTGGNEEHYIGNVGGAGMLDVTTSESHKQRGCYSDFDCPDETKCNDVGLCVPRIHTLPRSRHTLQMGRGREKEKPTTNT